MPAFVGGIGARFGDGAANHGRTPSGSSPSKRLEATSARRPWAVGS
jgi:hypothetical protein